MFTDGLIYPFMYPMYIYTVFYINLPTDVNGVEILAIIPNLYTKRCNTCRLQRVAEFLDG